MKNSSVFHLVIAACSLICMPALGDQTGGDRRPGDTTIGDIRTGDISHHTHIHMDAPARDRRAYYAGGRVGLALHGIFVPGFSGKMRDLTWGGVGDLDMDFDRTFGGGASLVFPLGELGRFDIGADFLPHKWKEDSRLKIRMIPVTAAFRLGVPLGDILFLYGGGGGGYSFNEFKVPGFSESGGDFIYFACGGVEIQLSPEISLRGEGRYYWHEYDAFEDLASVKLDHFQMRTGMVFWF